MAAKINFKSAALFILAFFAAVIFISSLILNGLREYEAVRPVEFCIVPICLLCAAVRLKETGTDGALLCCALLFTICADVFMILFESYYTLSLVFFSLAQLFYWARILNFRLSLRYLAISAGVRVAACAVLCTVATVVVSGEALLGAAAAFYFANLAINTAEAFALCARDKGFLPFALGLLLFIGCDVCVGLNSAYMAGIAVSAKGYYALSLLIWIFYMPSQALLSVSGRKKILPAEKKGAGSEQSARS